MNENLESFRQDPLLNISTRLKSVDSYLGWVSFIPFLLPELLGTRNSKIQVLTSEIHSVLNLCACKGERFQDRFEKNI